MLRLILVCLLTLVSLTTSCRREEPVKKTALIFDGAMDLNDLYSLYLVATSPKIDLLGVSIAGSKTHYFSSAPQHAKSVLYLAGKPNVPVSSLLSTTFCSPEKLPSDWTELIDDISLYNLPPSPSAPLETTGSELIYQLVSQATEKVTILCVGSLNNIANFISTYPDLTKKIERVVMLAGVLHTTESITLPFYSHWEEGASYNVFIDPCAADVVLSSKVPITLIPLAVASLVPNTQEVLDRYALPSRNPGSAFVLKAIKSHANSDTVLAFCTFWDLIGVMTIIEPTIITLQKTAVDIITEPGPDFGRLTEAEGGQLVQLCTSIDPKRFYETLFNMINTR